MLSETEWKQLTIVHLTDLHFGARHIFNPPGGGDPTGQPHLHESILKDMDEGSFALPNEFPQGIVSAGGPVTPTRVIIAITGDFNERCVEPEFQQARELLNALDGRIIFGSTISFDDIFLVPGNHDLKYAESAVDDRWSKYCIFYSDHERKRSHPQNIQPGLFDPRYPDRLTRIIDQSSRGLIVAEINSSAYVRKGTDDERRGQVDQGAISDIDTALALIPERQKNDAIKIALVHHHPVVLPVLAEEDKGYDAILNSELLLEVLKRHGFHLLLHGHKHSPYTFSYDAVCAWTTDRVQPLLVVAGGSVGSREIPGGPGATNTYNVIAIKWHANALQARIHIETRGLVTHNKLRQRLPSPQWQWETLRLDDRLLAASGRVAASTSTLRERTPFDIRYDNIRSEVILNTRRNFPCIEVFPSLNPTQGYEARVWIEGQPHPEYQPPVRVEWSSNPRDFREVYVCSRESDPEFRARFAYYGPTLIQARLFWEDHEAQAYIYARIPRSDRL